MGLRKGEFVEVNVERVALGGQGVARVEGFVLFVSGALPGDRVKARVVKKKKGYAQARVEEILAPSPDRVSAPCPYAGHCGGCQWQHARYEKQLAYKKGIVEEALVHLGGLEGVPVHDVVPSERQFGYRNKMEFSFSDRRWLLPGEMAGGVQDDGFALGLHVPGDFCKVLDVDACLLQEETGNHILRDVKEYAKTSGMPVYSLRRHEGFWRFLTLRRALRSDQWMVNIVTSTHAVRTVGPLAERLCGRFENIAAVVNNITRRKAGVAVGESEVNLYGDGVIRERIGAFLFEISANSFFQTNTPGAEILYDMILRFAELRGSESVLDLYSGTGTIPVFLSRRALRVTGMEIVEAAVADAERNCRLNGIDNCRFICGDIRRMLNEGAETPDVLIVDPPRSGMHKDVLAKLLHMSPERIVYVSCNPATLARDLALMNAGYEIQEIQPVDMFPHTPHVETVAKLARRP